MHEINDVLSGFTTGGNNPEYQSVQYFLEKLEEMQFEIRRTNRKLKKSQEQAELAKKYKKKNRKLKKKYNAANQQSSKRRWDGLIEKSVPKFIDLATVVIDRKLAQPKK